MCDSEAAAVIDENQRGGAEFLRNGNVLGRRSPSEQDPRKILVREVMTRSA